MSAKRERHSYPQPSGNEEGPISSSWYIANESKYVARSPTSLRDALRLCTRMIGLAVVDDQEADRCLARYGGEERAVMFQNDVIEPARRMGERSLRANRHSPFIL